MVELGDKALQCILRSFSSLSLWQWLPSASIRPLRVSRHSLAVCLSCFDCFLFQVCVFMYDCVCVCLSLPLSLSLLFSLYLSLCMSRPRLSSLFYKGVQLKQIGANHFWSSIEFDQVDAFIIYKQN